MYNFTPEDLLQYHYNELGEEETAMLEESLQHDWALREKLNVIQEAGRRLDKSFYAPRQEAVRRIMEYATAASVQIEG